MPPWTWVVPSSVTRLECCFGANRPLPRRGFTAQPRVAEYPQRTLGCGGIDNINPEGVAPQGGTPSGFARLLSSFPRVRHDDVATLGCAVKPRWGNDSRIDSIHSNLMDCKFLGSRARRATQETERLGRSLALPYAYSQFALLMTGNKHANESHQVRDAGFQSGVCRVCDHAARHGHPAAHRRQAVGARLFLSCRRWPETLAKPDRGCGQGIRRGDCQSGQWSGQGR